MATTPINAALDKLEAALALIEQHRDDARPTPAPQDDQEAANRRHEAVLADRDRTIAKLEADLADIGKLKDEEIAHLRAELAAGPVATAASAAPHPAEAKHARLQEAAERTIAGIDRILAQNGMAGGGNG